MQRSDSAPRRVFVVGAQRCGTTYLHRLLDSHPDITMAAPVRPEPKIFLSDDVTGDHDAYDARAFPQAPTTAVRGEKGTSYIEHPAALDRMAATFPDAHVVVVLRDPIERALSNYRFSVDHGLEDLGADEALLADLDGEDRPYDRARISVSPYAYVRRGRYLPYLREVERRFRPDRVHVVVFEDLVAGTDALRRLYAALSVDPDHRPPMTGAVTNASQAAAALAPATRARLRAHFAETNAALARHLGRSLDAWQ
ncbi:MAG TPA: sulfotransferase [Euzebyales bacterium]